MTSTPRTTQDSRFVAMFAYDDAVAERYPTIRAGVIHATGTFRSNLR